MGRIFIIIAAVTSLMIVISSSGTYWFSAMDTDKAKRDAVATIIANSAVNIAQQLETLQKSVDGLAQSPDVVAALASANPQMIAETAAKVQTLVPHSLRVRLLLPGVNDLDTTQTPHMGFGDLEMVRATLADKPNPVIQGEAEHRHLAITSVVRDGQRVVGVVLASLEANLPSQMILKTRIANGLIELKQERLVLAATGEARDKNREPVAIPVSNTRWTIDAWVDVGASLSDMAILGSLIILPVLMSCLAYLIGYRKLRDFFRLDQSSILMAAKDMIQGKHVGNYPMRLEEMQPIIVAMAQFKRVIDQEAVSPAKHGDSDKDDFFDESFGLDFLEDAKPVKTEQFQVASVPVIPVTTAPVIPVPRNENQGMEQNFKATSTMESLEMEFDIDVFGNSAETETISSATSMPTIFHRYGVVGVAGKELDDAAMRNMGRAFASEARQIDVKTVVVARDGRVSSPSLAQALIDGIVSTGCDVIDLGLVPTPVLYFVAHHTEGRSGVMVTGGDLPAEYNGLKMQLHDMALSDEQLQVLQARIADNDYIREIPGSAEQNTLFSNEYIGTMSEEIHIVRPMTVVLDCSNGAAGQIGSMLLKTIGCEVIELNCDIDGRFPGHQPDPCDPANLQALAEAVRTHSADVGIALGADGESMELVDSSGKIIWPDRQMMLFARDVLMAKPGSEIIHDMACSQLLPEKIKKHAGFSVQAKSGRVHLQNALKSSGAALAGGMDGQFLFNDHWFGFADGLYAAVRMIQILSADTRPSAEVFAALPDRPSTPEIRIALAGGETVSLIERMAAEARFNDAIIIDTDGLRVEFIDGWGLVRASNTMPALELRFEADTHDALRRIQSQFKSLMLKIKPGLFLPF
ncbi:MAG: phosphomannomutase/phosphoglucomutase [Methylomonas sp.]|nr:phosphomannomutase/phosphoglucomutase [Methylomonas sp.]